MYIPDFWCGVFATLISLIIASVAYTIYQEHKKRK